LRVIIGYGNTLRGEDGFGVEVISLLQKQDLKDTKLISAYQLTPELCLDLLDASKIIFIDACYGKNHYAQACDITESQDTNLSHHISPKIIISMLKNLYDVDIEYEIYSMITDEFDCIKDRNSYEKCVREVVKALSAKD
jgi:hydrogenase maturation protease